MSWVSYWRESCPARAGKSAGSIFAAENAIVPNAGLHMVRFHVGAQLAAQVLRRHGLAHGANVIANEVSVGFPCENLVGAKSDMTYSC